MKQLFTYLFLVISSAIIAQAPQSIPYQAVVRNPDGSVMANTAMTITFKIHDNTATGTVVYEENHTATTNTQGLISLNVGNGSVVSGTFSGINWGSGNKFLHVLMNAGNGVVDLGTQQMMSVPYALYSEFCNIKVSANGDTLYTGGGSYVIIPGVSAANFPNASNYGSVLLPGNTTCQNEYISVTGCGGQDSILYYDRYYSLVEIGGQCWFAENLATDKYSNGDAIPTGQANWQSTLSGAYAIYNDILANDAVYGKLYNWYTVRDTRNVCPVGWHVPSDCEWMFLEGYLGMPISDQEYSPGLRGTIQGGKLKIGLYWNSPNTGANNETGFSAVPGGVKGSIGTYDYFGNYGYFWTNSIQPTNRLLMYNSAAISRSNNVSKNAGLGIRCLKD